MDAVTSNLDAFGRGILNTVWLSLFGFGGAFAIGVVVAAFRVSPVPPLRALATTYVEVVRNTPLVVVMILFFFGLPKVEIRFSPFTTAALCLALYTGTYVGEAIRSGINSVAHGQAEAARALGLGFGQVLGLVVLPQALRTVVQPLGNLFIACTKNSAVAYTIGVVELTGTADRLGNEAAQSVATLFAAGVGYLALTLPAGLVVGLIERRVAIKR